VLVDGLGNPFKVLFTGGNVHDSTVALDILADFDITDSIVMGDRIYGAGDIRECITANGATFAIPPQLYHGIATSGSTRSIECFFNKLKHFRRFITRYVKLISCFRAFVLLACVIVLLK